jgi:hypothetical protein
MKSKPDWFLIVAAVALVAGALASLFLWDWRYVVGGVVGAIGCAIAGAAVNGPDRR